MSQHNGEIASHTIVDVTMIQENVAVVQDVKHITVAMVGTKLYMAVFRNSCVCKMCKCKGIHQNDIKLRRNWLIIV